MKRFTTTADNEPGKGILVCRCYGNRTKFERIHAQYPLKFIPTTGHADRLGVVYMLSYGGGVISGDKFDVDIRLEQDSILLLMTQGNTKIFKDKLGQRLWLASLSELSQPTMVFSKPVEQVSGGVTSSAKAAPSLQIINYHVGADAILLAIPDPVTCFRDSSFQSRQVIYLKDETSQLVLLDWFTSGRLTRGENWSFRHYSSRIDVKVGNKLVIKDAMVLDDEDYMKENDGETAFASRLKPYNCFATLIMISSNEAGGVLESVETIQKKSEAMRLMPLTLKSEEDRQVLWSVSPILKNRGALIRIAGMTTEQVRDFVKYECLGKGLEKIVGEGMFKKVLM
ncbi:UreD-domain-containing protein [Backusella circina FSU 941]|nr:UreD-domain-containing protein [Backusella circina FSU 941]